jgi:nickel/cobalt transporter (NicO) family protein
MAAQAPRARGRFRSHQAIRCNGACRGLRDGPRLHARPRKTVIVSYYLGRPAGLLGSIGTSAIFVLTHVGSAVVLVLAGFIVIRHTIVGAGRAPAFETASAVLIIAIGLWLLFRAWHPHDHSAMDGRVLAFATGLVPCPLTTFIMVYATGQGIIAAGLLVTAGMAVGMTVTIALFALAAVLLHDRFTTLFRSVNRR